LALTVNQLGMSLGRMGRASENVRFLDDLDVTISLDSRKSTAHQMTSVEISAQPIVFRASYRDINLIMAIVNRAIELSSKPQGQAENEPQEGRPGALSSVSSSMPPVSQHQPPPSRSRKPIRRPSHRSTSDAPKLMMSKEKVSLCCRPCSSSQSASSSRHRSTDSGLSSLATCTSCLCST
jgi:vacuolar protein sorting-associated protein 13A/C